MAASNRGSSPPSYDRAPSAELLEMLRPGNFLSPLVDLNKRAVGDHVHDVHFRSGDEVHVYRGLTRLLCVKRFKRSANVKVTAVCKYSSQQCAEKLVRTWCSEECGFRERLNDYLHNVCVNPRFLCGEGVIQQEWAQVTWPWIPFDREGRLRGGGRNEVDQLAVDSNGRLVIIELKDASDSEVYDAPRQLQRYAREWHSALKRNPHIQHKLQAVIEARVALGLTPEWITPLSHGIRAVVAFGPDKRTDEVKRRYKAVLKEVKADWPEGVGFIETWEFTDGGPHVL